MKRLVSAAGVLVLMAGIGCGEGLNVGRVAGWAQWVVHMDAEAFRTSQLGALMLQQLDYDRPFRLGKLRLIAHLAPPLVKNPLTAPPLYPFGRPTGQPGDPGRFHEPRHRAHRAPSPSTAGWKDGDAKRPPVLSHAGAWER